MKPPSIEKFRVKALRQHLLDRRFSIPKLQRNFVWNSGRAAKLLDSIYRQMPIGSIFIWEMDRKSAHLIRQSADVLPSFNRMNKFVWFVIDGQQRLSVIYQAFEGQVRENDSGNDIDFGRLCFVLEPDKNDDNAERIVYRKPVDRKFISVKDILSSDWKSRFAKYNKPSQKRIKDCRDLLLNYPVPVVIVRSASLEEIGDVFVRVNSTGMRITSADKAVALMGNLDVREMAQELRQRVRANMFSISGIDSILMGFNLVSEPLGDGNDAPKLEALAKRWTRRIEKDGGNRGEFRKLWDKYQNAFSKAVDYLRDQFLVYDETYLPSANMLATLSVFFYHQPGQPNRAQKTEIRKWFWSTGVAERYSGRGYYRNIATDTKFFVALADGKTRHFTFTDYLDPTHDIQAAEYTARSSKTRAFFCLLASLQPLYLENGEPIPLRTPIMSLSNQKHRHHVFPRSQMSAHFSTRAYNSLCNICFLVSRDNQKIGNRMPRSYLDEYREGQGRQFRKVMGSHLIPVGKDSGVWERGTTQAFKKFRKKRLAMICAEFEKAAGTRLFRRE